MEPFVGEIRLFAGNFAPKGWAFCEGQLLSLAQNTALFSLLGVNYGGNGRDNFALPNLNGCVAVGAGESPQGFCQSLGETAGTTPAVIGPAQGGDSTLGLKFIIALQGVYPPRG